MAEEFIDFSEIDDFKHKIYPIVKELELKGWRLIYESNSIVGITIEIGYSTIAIYDDLFIICKPDKFSCILHEDVTHSKYNRDYICRIKINNNFQYIKTIINLFESNTYK